VTCVQLIDESQPSRWGQGPLKQVSAYLRDPPRWRALTAGCNGSFRPGDGKSRHSRLARKPRKGGNMPPGNGGSPSVRAVMFGTQAAALLPFFNY
jgi:hypothetical protein